ncbi:hypothetical protein TNCV_4695021 [Trichonephila clavipes]|nr:hypothetical protein TNCV_4695021 [Trichonephila clavipes]
MREAFLLLRVATEMRPTMEKEKITVRCPQIDYIDVLNDFAMTKARRKPMLSKYKDSTKNEDGSKKAPFAIVLTSTNGDFMYAEKADLHYMYDHANGDGRAALRMYHAQLPHR